MVDWNANHQDPGPGKDRTAAAGPMNSDGSDRYAGIQYYHGRVNAWTNFWYPATDLAAARGLFVSDMPGDAQILQDVSKSDCVKVEYQSARLAQATGDSGQVLVAFYTLNSDGSTAPFDPTSVNEAIVLTMYPSGITSGC